MHSLVRRFFYSIVCVTRHGGIAIFIIQSLIFASVNITMISSVGLPPYTHMVLLRHVTTIHGLTYHLFLNQGGRWDTTDDFATSFLNFTLFSTALWDMVNSRSVHSLMLSSHLFLSLPCLLPPPPPSLCLARWFGQS